MKTKDELLCQLLEGLIIYNTKELKGLKYQLFGLLFSENEVNVRLAHSLKESLALDWSKEMSLLIQNVANSDLYYCLYNNNYYYEEGEEEELDFEAAPAIRFAYSNSWHLWNIDRLSPLIKYFKQLSHFEISPPLPYDKAAYLQALKQLPDRSAGCLTILPDELGELSNLDFLRISHVPLRKIPETLYQLSLLERWVITFTRLSKLPEGISKLKKLKYLIVSDNLLETLPEELADMQQLKVLNIKNNPLKKDLMPERFFDAKHCCPTVFKAINNFFGTFDYQ